MGAEEHALVRALIHHNEEMRVTAVGMMIRIFMNSVARMPDICFG